MSNKVNITVTGSAGFLGRHLRRHLCDLGHQPYGVTFKVYDLRRPAHLDALFKHTGPPDILYHLAANVGGIQYNIANPANIFYDNVMMTTQLIHQAMLAGCKKFVMVGTVCSYPTYNPIPTREHRLFEGEPEQTNGAYGVAKLIALTQLKAYHQQFGLNYAYPVLSNLYGPGDAFDDENKTHVIPALIKRFVSNPPKITIWGDGNPTRDFLYVEDAARALGRFLEVDCLEPVNIANGVETSIRWLVESLARITGYEGAIEYDATKPNGQMRRGYDSYKAHNLLGWRAQVGIDEGLERTVEWYKQSLLPQT